MDHSYEFMILLKHIYMFASEKDIFCIGKKHEAKSSYAWEKLIFKTGGFIDRGKLK